MINLSRRLPGRRAAFQTIAWTQIIAGTGLLLLTLVNHFITPVFRHPRDERLRAIVSRTPADRPFNLQSMTQLVHRGTDHSVERRIAWFENWLQWTFGHFYAPFAHVQNPRRLVDGVLADCGERCQILKEVAEQSEFRCRFVGLQGHIVLEVQQRDGQADAWQVADPDYGVVYPVSADVLQSPVGEAILRRTLVRDGYRESVVNEYVALVQSVGDNVVLPIGHPLSPRLHAAESACDWLVWVIPLGLLLSGVWCLPNSSKPDGLRTRRQRQFAEDYDQF